MARVVAWFALSGDIACCYCCIVVAGIVDTLAAVTFVSYIDGAVVGH